MQSPLLEHLSRRHLKEVMSIATLETYKEDEMTGKVRSGQVRSGQVRSGQVRSGQVRSGQHVTLTPFLSSLLNSIAQPQIS